MNNYLVNEVPLLTKTLKVVYLSILYNIVNSSPHFFNKVIILTSLQVVNEQRIWVKRDIFATKDLTMWLMDLEIFDTIVNK